MGIQWSSPTILWSSHDITRYVKAIVFGLSLVAAITSFACGAVGSIASPTPVPTEMPETPTPTLTDIAKADITELFNRQFEYIKNRDWQSAFQVCTPSYRARRDVARFMDDLERYLLRHDTSPDILDVRNPEVTKGRDDRFDIDYDLYIADKFSETIRVGGAYVQVQQEWFDDGVWCR